MRILAVSDVDSKYYFDYYTPGKLDGIDLILACGDLHREYLEFLVAIVCLIMMEVDRCKKLSYFQTKKTPGPVTG